MSWDILDWLMEHIGGWFVLAAILAICVGLPLGLYALVMDSQSPTMQLRKADWACTQSQTIPITTYVMSGKVMVPITTYTSQCNQWNRQ